MEREKALLREIHFTRMPRHYTLGMYQPIVLIHSSVLDSSRKKNSSLLSENSLKLSIIIDLTESTD
jgi:hypothetical protein